MTQENTCYCHACLPLRALRKSVLHLAQRVKRLEYVPSLEMKLAQVCADHQGIRLPDVGEETREAIKVLVASTEPIYPEETE